MSDPGRSGARAPGSDVDPADRQAQSAGGEGRAGGREPLPDFLDFEPGERNPPPCGVEPGLVRAFLRWFAGRGDVYARQWFDARKDRGGYWPVRAPLTAAVAEQHLLGRHTIGQYVLFADETVSFAALDLDPTVAALAQLRIESEPPGPAACPPLAEYACRIAAAAARAGVEALLEDSGGDGMHLWWFFEPRVRAREARDFLRELLWRAGPQPPAVAVELFPKQDRLTGKGLGNLIKLPLGVHQKTLRPSRFLDAGLGPLAAWDGLARIRPCDRAAFERLAGARVTPLPVRGAEVSSPAGADVFAPCEQAPPRGDDPPPADARGLAVALAQVPAGRASEEAADRILEGCAVLRELARKAHEEQWLSADEARALVYSVGLVGRENRRIEEVLAKAGVPRKELDRARRGLQAPVGCRRLRERFPGLCAGCACPAPVDGYATPALFAVAPRPRRRAVEEVPPPDFVQDPATLSPAELLERLRRLEERVRHLGQDREE